MGLEHFYNSGFGWVCRYCEKQLEEEGDRPSRLMAEGEAESKTPRLSTKALAKWADPEQRTLVCPRCGVTELIDRS